MYAAFVRKNNRDQEMLRAFGKAYKSQVIASACSLLASKTGNSLGCLASGERHLAYLELNHIKKLILNNGMISLAGALIKTRNFNLRFTLKIKKDITRSPYSATVAGESPNSK
jgi:hypothetical protein